MVIEKQEELVLELSRRVSESAPLIIGIDGYLGVGKSRLAGSIANHLEGKWIEVDEFVDEGTGRYLRSLQLERLGEEISVSRETYPILVVDGVCLLAVLGRLGIVPDILVYVRRVDSDGDWCCWDELICDTSRPLGGVFPMIDGTELRPGQGDLDREIARYHRCFKPLESADYVLHVQQDE